MIVTFDAQLDRSAEPVKVEASVFPRKVLKDPSSDITPGSVVMSVRDAQGKLVDVPLEVERRFAREAVTAARQSVWYPLLEGSAND